MLSLLTCSVSRFDDSFDVPPSPLQQRRVSRSLSFIKSTSPSPRRRRVAKMTIGHPTNFRHEVHLGKEVVPENMISVWDSARWQQALEKDSRSSPPSSIASSTVPSSPTKCNATKRHSITPQKRKPVPSLIPDIDAMSSLTLVLARDIPLPPSPNGSVSESGIPECEPSGLFFLIPDPPRQSPSVDDDGEIPTSQTAEDDTVETTPATQENNDER